ncbi:hypothetical protein WMY93_005832 [Mugilogobius chulae]|uniref:Uncharacterized protein n=1 Tax=Mugilogobius chulae TaxID=88201 RepID=A0AAW0PI49_9GOBI
MANGMKARLQIFNLFNSKQEQKDVPEIISTLRQVGKSSARNNDSSTSSLSAGHDLSGKSLNASSVSSGPTATGPISPTAFAKKFEVLFCGRLPSLQTLDENGLSPEISNNNTTECAGIQPTSLLENRTMLFTVGRCQIYLVSPDTKKVAMEKSFREISFCSQVDEIMLTLKQAFSVAAMQQSAKTQSQQCDSCPMQQLHKLCERIEGLHPSKTKLELQRHLATLNNDDQASVFENTMGPPKGDQEENELIMTSLRNLYEERQKHHQHSLAADSKRVCGESLVSVETQQQSTSRQRLEQFKSRAKRSLTESLEGIWKGSSKSRTQKETNEMSASSSSISTINSSTDQTLPDPQLRPNSPLKCHNSTGDLKQLDSSLSQSSKLPTESPSSRGFRRRASTYSHPSTPPLPNTCLCLQSPTLHMTPLLPPNPSSYAITPSAQTVHIKANLFQQLHPSSCFSLFFNLFFAPISPLLSSNRCTAQQKKPSGWPPCSSSFLFLCS